MTDALRSMLFTPGHRADMIAKAIASGTDAVIVDLEDAVPKEAKAEARAGLAELPDADIPLYVRINDATTDEMWDDVVAAGTSSVAGVVLPKAEDPQVLLQIDGALRGLEMESGMAPGSKTLVPLIESSIGVRLAYEMLSCTDRITSTLFGSGEQGDLVADLGATWTPDGVGLSYARGAVLLSARAAGIAHPMDAVFMDFRDLDALRVECELAKTVGYVGKVAIHPAQLAVIHDVFTPTPEEVAYNQMIIDAFDEALANGEAAISIDGRMIDYAVVRVARGVVERAEAAERAAARGRGGKERT